MNSILEKNRLNLEYLAKDKEKVLTDRLVAIVNTIFHEDVNRANSYINQVFTCVKCDELWDIVSKGSGISEADLVLLRLDAGIFTIYEYLLNNGVEAGPIFKNRLQALANITIQIQRFLRDGKAYELYAELNSAFDCWLLTYDPCYGVNLPSYWRAAETEDSF